MPNDKKDSEQNNNIRFLKWLIILILVLFLFVDIGIYQNNITYFHYLILLFVVAIFLTITNIVSLKIDRDGKIKFEHSNTKEQKQPNTNIENYYYVNIPYSENLEDTSFEISEKPNDLKNKTSKEFYKFIKNITKNHDQKPNPKNRE